MCEGFDGWIGVFYDEIMHFRSTLCSIYIEIYGRIFMVGYLFYGISLLMKLSIIIAGSC